MMTEPMDQYCPECDKNRQVAPDEPCSRCGRSVFQSLEPEDTILLKMAAIIAGAGVTAFGIVYLLSLFYDM